MNKHLKARYKPRKEKNGRVKVLSTREKNLYNYEDYLLKSLKDEKILNTFVIVLIAYPEKIAFTTQAIADIIEDFSRKNDIPILRSTNHTLRGRLGAIRKSRLSQFMYFYERNTPKNKDNIMKYGIVDKYLHTLTIDDAIKLAYERKKEFKKPGAVLNPERSARHKKEYKPKLPPSPPVEIPEKPESPPQSNIVDEIIEQDRKSTRLNSSHTVISYAVFCLKKKNKKHATPRQEIIK